MASSPTIALRIPQRLLDQLDEIATKRYPIRNGSPNRSKMILYFIEKGLEELCNSRNDALSNSNAVSHNDMSDNSNTVSNTGLDNIRDFIRQQVAQQVQIQLQIQQQVRQELKQTSPSLDPASEIAKIWQEIAEVKKF